MKLTASPHFPEKRIGYLGMMLLLSEDADVLMLATNALKNDLNSDNRFVAGLALCCIGNLATADMSRDLAPEVDKHLKSPLAYLRKKACLAMARCLTKCPEMVEDFTDRVVTLLKDKSHGVLVCVVQLMAQVLIIDQKNAIEEGIDPYETDCRSSFLRLVPTLVKMLRNLIGSGYSPEHDIAGISDPFLQVQILILLRLLGTNNRSASEEMNDVMAQVASNTETSKNAGNAILYECVQTIMGTESEDGLRVLAVNILGRFLLNRDNNIRYVALNTLAKCIMDQKQTGRENATTMDADNANNAMAALQRHRTTVVDCLKDPDISIRQRALELIYHLVNDSNVEALTSELLNYLVLCPREHRNDIGTRILKVVDRYSPDDRWRVDTLITTLTIAGREVSRDVQNATTVYISRADADIQAFATHKLVKALRDDDGSQVGLLAVGVWCIGEFGDVLLKPYFSFQSQGALGDLATNGDSSVSFSALDASTVIAMLDTVTNRHSCPEYIKHRALTAYVKLSQRYANIGDAVALNMLQKLLEKHKVSRSLELQLRSCEFTSLVNASKGIATPKIAPPPAEDDLFGLSASMNEPSSDKVSAEVQNAAKEALVRMPVVDLKILQKRLQAEEMQDGGDMMPRTTRAPALGAPKSDVGGDLLDIFGGDSVAVSTQNGGTTAASSGKSDMDLLADIFSAQPMTTASQPVGFDPFSAPMPQAQAPTQSAVNPMDLFGSPTMSAPAPTFGMQPTLSNDMFGAPAFPSNTQQTFPAQQAVGDLFGTSASPSAPSQQQQSAPAGIRVPGLSHGGLVVEFECTKPESWNLQKSILIAHFQNTTDAPIQAVNLQVAVPKYVKMEMEPPSSTTIPQPGSNVAPVTQKVTLKNSMVGQKNLMLKLKVGFTSKGQKVDHTATCSGFPAGQY